MSTEDHRRPRWVTALAIAAILLALLVGALHLTGGGPRHGMDGSGSTGSSR